ncbi:hypothetical protein ACFL1I_07390 [Candidatus Omnitrophota bacterium]
MDFLCPTCNQTMSYELKMVLEHTDRHIVEAIKKKHPHWVEQDGLCEKCYQHYRSQIPAKGER